MVDQCAPIKTIKSETVMRERGRERGRKEGGRREGEMEEEEREGETRKTKM